MNRNNLIESMAISEAAFDGRTFLGLSSVEKKRYLERCAVNLSSIEAQGLAIVPVEATDQQLNAALECDSIFQNIYRAMINTGRI